MLQNVTPVDSGAVSCYHDRHNWPLRGMGQLIFLDCPEFRGDIRSSETHFDTLRGCDTVPNQERPHEWGRGRHECLRHVIPTDACEKCGLTLTSSLRPVCAQSAGSDSGRVRRTSAP